MNALVFEKVGASLAAETSIGLTQDMVRIDSTNGKEDTLARDLAGDVEEVHGCDGTRNRGLPCEHHGFAGTPLHGLAIVCCAPGRGPGPL